MIAVNLTPTPLQKRGAVNKTSGMLKVLSFGEDLGEANEMPELIN